MSGLGTTYSREQLKELYTKNRKWELNNFVEENISSTVIAYAEEGRTEYFWQMMAFRTSPKAKSNGGTVTVPVDPPFPYEEIVGVLKEKFPGTTIELKEETVDRPQGKITVKRGIRIDWS